MATRKSDAVFDANGEMVHRFALTMNNLGLGKAAHEIEVMLDSQRWRHFQLGAEVFEFLPGEFDYFLTQQGVTREQVMALRDVAVKARVEVAMDERRTGEVGYRRNITEARSQVPQRPGLPIEPFGYTQKEAKVLVKGGDSDRVASRPPLGFAVRRYVASGGQTTKAPSEQRPRWERLATSVCRLPDVELARFLESVKTEVAQRKKRARDA
jgi:hypothetical protein